MTLPGPIRRADRIRGGVFEPTHGSAPDISGQSIANPLGTILSVALMFDYAFGRCDLAREIEHAVEATLRGGLMTPDLGGHHSTIDVTQAVIARLR